MFVSHGHIGLIIIIIIIIIYLPSHIKVIQYVDISVGIIL